MQTHPILEAINKRGTLNQAGKEQTWETVVAQTKTGVPVVITTTIKLQRTPTHKKDYLTAKHVEDRHYYTISVSGRYPGVGGQCRDSIQQGVAKGEFELLIPIGDFEQLCCVWERYHLNDMRAGTASQEKALKTWRDSPQYNGTMPERTVLIVMGLEPDRGYSWGSAWLLKQIPFTLLERTVDLLERCKNVRTSRIHPLQDLLNKIDYGVSCQGKVNSPWRSNNLVIKYTTRFSVGDGPVQEFDYFTGVDVKDVPTLEEILYYFMDDAPFDETDFANPKHAEAAKANTNKLKTLFTEQEWETLLEHYQDLEYLEAS
jgi:hypothetical protein